MDVLKEAKDIFNIEINALCEMRDSLGDDFRKIINIITACRGKVIITGMGKPGHIAHKMAATFSSLGTPSFYLNPADALHGDLGMVQEQDVVLVISYSGESDEILGILPAVKNTGASIIAITACKESTLAQNADVIQILPRFEEACHLKLVPTSSTTVELCYGDALAVVASMQYGFKKEDFGRLHPAGALGKKLIYKVDDLMVTGDAVPCIGRKDSLMSAITEISRAGLGMVVVVNEQKYVEGLLTDGGLRKILQKHYDIYTVLVEEVMTKNPRTIRKDAMAVNALLDLNEKAIHCFPVVDEKGILIGAVTWHMITNAGITM